MVVSDSLYELLPVMGFLITLPTSVYLLVMRRERVSGTPLAAIYAQHLVDWLFGVSLFYAGFHGVIVSVYSSESDEQQPVKCMYTALHLHAW